MKECTAHHFACDCREEKVRECLRIQYNSLRALIIAYPSECLIQRISSIMKDTKEIYEALYGTLSLTDLD